MSKQAQLALTSILAISALVATTSAQACMFGMASQSVVPACANAQAGNATCPASGGGGGGKDGNGCVLSKQDVSSAANTMGNMAAGGIGIAAGIMRALADQADRYTAPGPGI